MITTINNELHIAGAPVSRLVGLYGEPMYAYDAEVIEGQYNKLRKALPDSVDIMYSMKANPNASLVAFVGSLAQGVEVSSLRELHVAEMAGIAPDRLIFVGPAKSDQELALAIQKQIRCIVAESEEELEIIERIASTVGRTVDVALRLNPAFDSAGSRLKMGGAPRQFGIDEEQADEILRRVSRFRCASLVGIHVYLGTRILDYSVVVRNTRAVLDLAVRLQSRLGIRFKLVDFGGGLGVPYFDGEREFDIEMFQEEMSKVIAEASQSLPGVRFILESGRYLVADAGVYLTRVRFVKESRGQKFVLASGGMHHHMATTSVGTLVKSHFPMEALTKMDLPKTDIVTVCGPLCTPGDVLGKAVALPDVTRGDLLGILRSGAYGITASPADFLSHGRPVEVIVYKERDYLVRKARTVESILDDQMIVDVRNHAVFASTL